MELSKRLRMNADLVPPGAKVGDIGCDHGYVSIYLAGNKACSVIAMDVKKGPLSIAEKNIEQAGMKGVVECRLSDGLAGLVPGEADTLLIAGMGGMLICSILKKQPDVLWQVKTLVLQPQSDLYEVRKVLPELGFCIEKESFCMDAGKNYIAMRACRRNSHNPYSEAELMFGRYLPEKKDAAYVRYLEQEKEKYVRIKERLANETSVTSHARIQELSHILDLLDETLKNGR